MRISLLTKFLLSFFVTGIVLVGILITLMEFYAHENFSDYVGQTEYRQLDSLAAVLESEYHTHGGWDFLRHNHREWISILIRSGLIKGPPPHNIRPEGPPFPPPPPRGTGHPAPLEPHLAFPGRPPGPAPSHNELGPRVVLLDDAQKPVMGHRYKTLPRYIRPFPEEGPPIGYMGFDPPANLSHPLDIRFLKKQRASFYLAGALFLLCSVLVSYVLASHLLAPIQNLSRAARALARRRFDTRLKIRTGDELERLGEDFNRLASALGDYEHRQTQWLSDISHELRTPLSILKGELEAVQDGIRKLDDHSVVSLHAEVSRLTRLVNDLHDLSMAEAGMIQLNRTRVNPDLLLAETLDLFSDRFGQQDIRIRTDFSIDRETEGDPDRLIQLFSNLMKNSLAYTDSPGQFRITSKIQAPHIRILFEDSPPGVSGPTLPRLFDRLFRGEGSRSRSLGGSGLGLAICKYIVKAHGGSIRAFESGLGGLGLEIILPLKET